MPDADAWLAVFMPALATAEQTFVSSELMTPAALLG